MEWIDCKERLPDFEVDVLFTDGIKIYMGEYNLKDTTAYASYSNMNVDRINDIQVSRQTCGFIYPDEFPKWRCIEKTTHWMPLPKTPKED